MWNYLAARISFQAYSSETFWTKCVHAKSFQLCLTLCNTMDCSPPGFSVHGTLQARILECVAMPSSRGSSWSRDWTQVSYVSCIRQAGSLPLAPSGKPVEFVYWGEKGLYFTTESKLMDNEDNNLSILKLSAEELMLLNCGVGEDSWESLGLQGDPTSPS